MHDFILYGLPSFLLVLGVVVFIHEWGHYAVAKLCGVKIETFSIGFGRELFGVNDKSGTRWKISLLPLGGYVKMFGDADGSSRPDEKVHTMSAAEKQVSFFHKKVGQRAAIVFAGPGINFLFTFIVFILLFSTQGQPFTPPSLGEIAPASPAAEAGLQVGDTITAINNVPVSRFEDVRREVAVSIGEALHMQVLRAGQQLAITVNPRIAEVTDRFGGIHKMSQIGVKPLASKTGYRHLAVVPAIAASAEEMVNDVSTTLRAIGQIIMGTRGTEDLGGTLRIADMAGKISKDAADFPSWCTSIIWFMAVISLHLGLINLFPIPVLDGGHLFFYAIEAIKGSPVHEKITAFTMQIGFALVVFLMVFFTWNDLVQLKVVSTIRGLFA